MADPCTKFEVSNYTRYEDMRSCAKCTNWGSLVRLGVNHGHWRRRSAANAGSVNLTADEGDSTQTC